MAHAAEQRLELIKEEGTAKSPADTAASEVSDEVREIAAELLRKRKAGPKGAPLKLRTDESGTLHIGYRHSNEALGGTLLMADIGSASIAFFSGLMAQISVLGSHGKRVDEMNSNFVLSVVQTVKPQDELEAMLAAQMGAVHAATMMMARRLNHVETIPQQDAAERALNKLARTFAIQMEALKRYRTCGQQKVTVEHVTVNEGGQAIVGNVAHRGGGGSESER
jgi:hypothetical protein